MSVGQRQEDPTRGSVSSANAVDTNTGAHPNNTGFFSQGGTHDSVANAEPEVSSVARDLLSQYNHRARKVLLKSRDVHAQEGGGEGLDGREISPDSPRRRRGSNSVAMNMNMEYARSWTRAGLLQPQSFLSARSNFIVHLSSQSPSFTHTSPNESSSIAPRSSFSGGSRRDSNTANYNSSYHTDEESAGAGAATSFERSGDHFFSRSPSDIRANTVELSALPMPMLSVSRPTLLPDASHPTLPPLPLSHASSGPFLSSSQTRSPPFNNNYNSNGGELRYQPNERMAAASSGVAGPSYLVPYQMRTPLTSADLVRITSSVAPRMNSEVARDSPSDRGSVPRKSSPKDDGRSRIHAENSIAYTPGSVSSSDDAFGSSSSPKPHSDRGSGIGMVNNNNSSSYNNTPLISSTPSGLSILLAQQQSQSQPASEHSRSVGQAHRNCSGISGSEGDENRVLTQTQNTSATKVGLPPSGGENERGVSPVTTAARVDEQTPLLSSSPAPSASSLGPSHYFTTRPSTPVSEMNKTRWWPWSSYTQTSSLRTGTSTGEPGLLGSIGPGEEGNPLYKKSAKGTEVFVREMKRMKGSLIESVGKVRKVVGSRKTLKGFGVVVLSSIPAVLLGVLLNILDGLSYGMIMFPSTDVFQNFGGIGVSMFFVTTIISQLVYSFGGSGFAGANGSMMIEVVPFFHIIAQEITQEVGEENVAQVISTTIAAFALSSILTGLTFFILGYLRLGVIIGFFPRHILVGCIGGVGVFLLRTGLAVSARIDDDDFTYSFGTLKFLFGNSHILALWLPPFLLAVTLRFITHNFHHQLIFPAYFIAIPIIFYVIVLAAGLDVSVLRSAGWVFDMGGTTEKWYKFYSYYSWGNTSFRALLATMPTQLALLFFNILHPPLNVPALAVSLDEDVDTNKELVAHGYSNILAGLFGVVPNYLVYVNTLLFYRVGGTTRISGFLLAGATFVLLIVGTAPIGYIPIMLVGALIFVLGIDLVKEAVWDTRHRANKSEYLTIISIMICMSIWDFVIGVLFGIVICCFFFVVQNSRRRSIRATFTGDSAISAVRRPSAQRDYIRVVARQTIVLRLQGFLFFGTITQVEEAVRALVDPSEWHHNPIRFLVIDLTVVGGVDMSSAEAFVRIQRILSARSIKMVLCGFEVDSPIGRSLKSVGLLESNAVELFSTFNDAMEWTENAYLQAWFFSQKNESHLANKHHAIAFPGRSQESEYTFASTFHNSPRRAEIHAAAGEILENHYIKSSPTLGDEDANDAFTALTQAFSSYGALDREVYKPLLAALERIDAPAGLVLWNQGDTPDGLYLIESGVLSSIYEFPDRKDTFTESMVGGTLAGELSTLSGLPRNSRVVVEKEAVLWKLSTEELARLEDQHPKLMRDFLHLVLKVAKTDYDILFSALAARL